MNINIKLYVNFRYKIQLAKAQFTHSRLVSLVIKSTSSMNIIIFTPSNVKGQTEHNNIISNNIPTYWSKKLLFTNIVLVKKQIIIVRLIQIQPT